MAKALETGQWIVACSRQELPIAVSFNGTGRLLKRKLLHKVVEQGARVFKFPWRTVEQLREPTPGHGESP